MEHRKCEGEVLFQLDLVLFFCMKPNIWILRDLQLAILLHVSEETSNTVHISLVRSTMDYGGIIWDPYTETNINRLERIQRQAARFITGDYRSREEGSVSNMLEKLDLQELTGEERPRNLYSCTKWLRGWFLLLNQTIIGKKQVPRDLSLLQNLRTTRQLTSSKNKWRTIQSVLTFHQAKHINSQIHSVYQL